MLEGTVVSVNLDVLVIEGEGSYNINVLGGIVLSVRTFIHISGWKEGVVLY